MQVTYPVATRKTEEYRGLSCVHNRDAFFMDVTMLISKCPTMLID